MKPGADKRSSIRYPPHSIIKGVQSAITPATSDTERELHSLSTLTVVVVLATVTMTFGALIAVFFIRSQNDQFWGHIHVPVTLWFTTAVLLASSATLEAARGHLTRRDQAGTFRLIAWTTALGTLFLIGQVTAWFQFLHSGVILARNPHSWFLFLFSGLHGLHIVLGLAGLGYLLFRTREPASGPRYQMHNRAVASGVAVFWHYLDGMWVVLFLLLLLWRR
jgi:cytochrome c oxidase subunit 3